MRERRNGSRVDEILWTRLQQGIGIGFHQRRNDFRRGECGFIRRQVEGRNLFGVAVAARYVAERFLWRRRVSVESLHVWRRCPIRC